MEGSCAPTGLVVIGDEVLTGKTQDTNSHWLAQELYSLGAPLDRVVTIPDRVEVIAQTVAEMSPRCDVVFTSGGIGPTHDDVTYAGVAMAFGGAVTRHPALVARLEEHYRGALNDARLRMAEIPEPDELCLVEGMMAPVVRVRNVYILPGVPELFRQLFGALRERFRRRPIFLGQLLIRRAEGEIVGALDRVVAAHPAVRIGSYPRLDAAPYRVKIVVESCDERAAQVAYAALEEALEEYGIVEGGPVAPARGPAPAVK